MSYNSNKATLSVGAKNVSEVRAESNRPSADLLSFRAKALSRQQEYSKSIHPAGSSGMKSTPTLQVPATQQPCGNPNVIYELVDADLLALNPQASRGHRARHSDRVPASQLKVIRSDSFARQVGSRRGTSPSHRKAQRAYERAYQPSPPRMPREPSPTRRAKDNNLTSNVDNGNPQKQQQSMVPAPLKKKPPPKIYARSASFKCSLGDEPHVHDHVSDDFLLLDQSIPKTCTEPSNATETFVTPPRNFFPPPTRRFSGSSVPCFAVTPSDLGASQRHRFSDLSTPDSSVIAQLLLAADRNNKGNNNKGTNNDQDNLPSIISPPDCRKPVARAPSHFFWDEDSVNSFQGPTGDKDRILLDIIAEPLEDLIVPYITINQMTDSADDISDDLALPKGVTGMEEPKLMKQSTSLRKKSSPEKTRESRTGPLLGERTIDDSAFPSMRKEEPKGSSSLRKNLDGTISPERTRENRVGPLLRERTIDDSALPSMRKEEPKVTKCRSSLRKNLSDTSIPGKTWENRMGPLLSERTNASPRKQRGVNANMIPTSQEEKVANRGQIEAPEDNRNQSKQEKKKSSGARSASAKRSISPNKGLVKSKEDQKKLKKKNEKNGHSEMGQKQVLSPVRKSALWEEVEAFIKSKSDTIVTGQDSVGSVLKETPKTLEKQSSFKRGNISPVRRAQNQIIPQSGTMRKCPVS